MSTTTLAASPRRFIVRGRGLTLTRVGGLLAFIIPPLASSRASSGCEAGLNSRSWRRPPHGRSSSGSSPSAARSRRSRGFADFVWHVRGLREVSRKEERGEVVALALGGAPLFVIMAAASMSGDPRAFLLPAVVATMFTVACVCHDEFVYHRLACGRIESLFHRSADLRKWPRVPRLVPLGIRP